MSQEHSMQGISTQQIQELATTTRTRKTDERTQSRPTTSRTSKIAKTNPSQSVTTQRSKIAKTNPTTAMTTRPLTSGDPFGASRVTEASSIIEVSRAETSAPKSRRPALRRSRSESAMGDDPRIPAFARTNPTARDQDLRRPIARTNPRPVGDDRDKENRANEPKTAVDDKPLIENPPNEPRKRPDDRPQFLARRANTPTVSRITISTIAKPGRKTARTSTDAVRRSRIILTGTSCKTRKANVRYKSPIATSRRAGRLGDDRLCPGWGPCPQRMP